MIRQLFILAFLLLLAAHAVAQDFDVAAKAYDRGDYVVALEEWQSLAGQGVAEAQYNLGLMYKLGLEVTQDFTRAAKWYRRAAKQDLTSAQLQLGHMHTIGQGVPADTVQAYKWLARSAAQCNQDADLALDGLAARMSPDQIKEAQTLADERARWYIDKDMNCDGLFTVSDVGLWIKWLYFAPGDGLFWSLLQLKALATFLELTADIYGGWVSGVLSLVAWFIALGLIGFIIEALEKVDRRLTGTG